MARSLPTLRDAYPCALPTYAQQKGSVNSFTFVKTLGEELSDNELIVPGASGTSFTCTHQTLAIRHGQQAFTSNGFAEMGFDLPGAIGACIAKGRKRTILITGDGSIQMNLQELQTIIHHQLPIKIFYMNNSGYLTIRHTQTGLFKERTGWIESRHGRQFSGHSEDCGKAYGFVMFRVSETSDLRATIRQALDAEGPTICERSSWTQCNRSSPEAILQTTTGWQACFATPGGSLSLLAARGIPAEHDYPNY